MIHSFGLEAIFREARTSCALIALIALCSLGAPTSAQSKLPASGAGLPSGIYASSSCDAPSEIWVLAAGHELFASEDTFFLSELNAQSGLLAHGWRSYGDFFARALPGGEVEYILWSAETSEPHPDESAWPDILPRSIQAMNSQWTGSRFVPCTAVPLPFSVLHGESARMLLDIEPALASCATGSSDCLADVFAAVDKHPDGELNKAELSRLVRVFIHLGAASQDAPSSEDLAAWTGASVLIVPLVATGLISSYDYDGNGGLSFGEIAGELAGTGRLMLGAEDQAGARGQAREMLGQAQESLSQLRSLLEILR